MKEEIEFNTETNLRWIPCKACANWKCQFSRNLCPQCSVPMKIVRKGMVVLVPDENLNYDNPINNAPMGFMCGNCICNFGLKGQKL